MPTIEQIVDDHVAALVHGLYGASPTELELAQVEQHVRWAIYKIRRRWLLPATEAPRHSSDPEREEMHRRLSLGYASEDTIRPRENVPAR